MRNNHTLTFIGILIFVLGLMWLLSTIVLGNIPSRNNQPTGTTTQNISTPLGQNFSEAGNIVRNNPGQLSGVWYLIFERPGQPALSAPLLFNESSTCQNSFSSELCNPGELPYGARVEVKGVQSPSGVQVTNLVFVQALIENGLPIKLYYYNPNLDQGPGGAQCSSRGIVPVERVIPRTTTPIQDSVKLLLRGEITDGERAQGIVSDFPLAGVTLQSASLSNGTLTLVFNDPESKTSGGACRAGILWKEIEAVAKQFPGVSTVRFLPADLFQP